MKKKCQFCGAKVEEEDLVLARDPWDNYKEKWVCKEADTCAVKGRKS